MSTMQHLMALPVNEQLAFITHWAQLHQGLNSDQLNELIFTCTYYDAVRIDYLRSVAASFHYSA